MNTTARFLLPFILPGQAQKELYHNEALARIDAALQPTTEGDPLSTPPQGPQIGQSWIVAPGGSGDWAGHDQHIAVWTEGGWRFIAPHPGTIVWNKERGLWVHWTGIEWSAGEVPASALVIGGKQVVGERRPAVPSPSGGTIIDAEARAAINALIATLMSHGMID